MFTHARRGGGGSIVRKTPDTALYSIYVSTLWACPFRHLAVPGKKTHPVPTQIMPPGLSAKIFVKC